MLSAIALASGCGGAQQTSSTTTPPVAAIPLQDAPSAPETLLVESDDFEPNGALAMQQVFAGFGCTGENRSPSLRWSGAPEGTRSYAIVVHDPDAPTGVGFFHWVVVDLPASATSIESGAALPEGARALHTDFGGPGYGGPCPPPGPAHRYVFSVYALDVDHLELPDGATGALVRFAIAPHVLSYGRLVGTFAR
ncbi:Phospholipid-binding protein [Sandaracinus amylolyticus]|uniref:Phospholipid-binding protein n=1 Tax=Sandaracinus amylolyticus TaxID=927083 RepID=A0A0F6W3B0_9BACT|nr:Phospholipid-binding protein [Sandaracinus amylolyticus]